MSDASLLTEEWDVKKRHTGWTSAKIAFGTLIFASIAALSIGLGVGLTRKHPQAAPVPEQIAVSFINGMNTNTPVAFSVNWVIPFNSSWTGVPNNYPNTPVVNRATEPINSRVEWGLTPSSLQYITFADSNTYDYVTNFSSYHSPLLLNATIGCVDAPPYCNSILKPGQTVYYRVGDDVNGFSTVRNTRLPTPPGQPGARIAIVGDLGTTNNSVATIEDIYNFHTTNASFDAFYLVGDESYADSNQPIWDEYFRMFDYLYSTIPYTSNIGNHEWFDTNYTFIAHTSRTRSPAHYQPNFNASKLYYSVDIGMAHIISLQSYCPEMSSITTQPCLAAGTAQLQWLINDLQNVNRNITPWVIVNVHIPIYNSNLAHTMSVEGNPLRFAIENVLNDYGVDLVIAGHVHAMERTTNVFNLTYSPTAPSYITVGDGGNREGLATQWAAPQPGWSVFRRSTYGHGQLAIINETVMQWQWFQNPDFTPHLGDEYWFVKGVPGPNFTEAEHVTAVPAFVDPQVGVFALRGHLHESQKDPRRS